MNDQNTSNHDAQSEAQLPLESLRQVRIEKLKKLKDLGLEAFPSKSNRTHHISDIVENFSEYENKEATICGRLMSWREHGSLIFGDVRDASGKIQLYIKTDEVKPFDKDSQNLGHENFGLLDLGDFVEATGTVTKTKRGEISILLQTIRILTKSVRPMPSAHFGLKDEEDRYRQRYVDLVLNPELRDLFLKKSKFWNAVRNFMISKNFIEVETPVLENSAGGADATPFVTHHNALDIDVYLRISMGELWQKRLMVGGFEKTFELGRQFRNEGMSREHLQDYTQMEFYWAYANYKDSMALVEEMYKFIAQETFGTSIFKINGFDVDLNKTWEQIDYRGIILERHKIDIMSATKDELAAKARELKAEFDSTADRGRLIDLIWKNIRKTIAGPAFLVGHPVDVSPLAKRDINNPDFTERYQVILAGSEMGNGYSELNDPIDQAERFEAQQKLREAGDTEAQMHDYDFVRALEYGMPPVTGFGVSERLFSFLADKTIRECVLFPLLRPEFENHSKVNHSNYNLRHSVEFNSAKFKSQIDGINHFYIDDAVKNDFPRIHFAHVVIKNVKVEKSNAELERLKANLVKSKSIMAIDDIQNIKSIAGYRDIIKNSKSNPTKNRPSPEALLRRIAQGKGLYSINTAVDAYNLAVIETGIGLGGFDINEIVGPVCIRYAKKGEIMNLHGDDAPTVLDAGRIIYSDSEKPLTLDLNYRDIIETEIKNSTKDIILFADGVSTISEDETVESLKLGAFLIQKFCGGTAGEIFLVK